MTTSPLLRRVMQAGVMIALSGVAAASDITFRRLSLDEGLSQSLVLCILQDRRGFMWFGTEDGLNRFDGHTFISYRHNPLDSNSLSNSNIWSLHESRDSALWIGTWGGGLNRFDPVRNVFTRYRHEEGDPSSLSDNRIASIAEDAEGILWISTAGGGLNRFDPLTQRFDRIRLLEDPPAPPGTEALFCLLRDRDNILWIGTYSGGLIRFDPASGTFRRMRHDPSDATSLSDDRVLSLCEDRQGNLWVGTWGGGLNRLHRKSGAFTRFRHRAGDSFSLPGDIVRTLLEDSDGSIWTGTMGGGAARYDPASGTFLRYRYSPFDPSTLSDNVVVDMHEDAGGTLWFGTAGGLSVYSRYAQKFTRYHHEADNPRSLGGRRVFALCEDSAGTIWVGTEDAGLDAFDPRTQSFRHFRHRPGDRRSIGSDNISALLTDRSGTLWVGTRGGGLSRSDGASGSFYTYSGDPGDPSSLRNSYISTLAEDGRGRIWVGTWTAGVGILDRTTETFRWLQQRPGAPGALPDNEIRCIYPDRDGTIWIGTVHGGLTAYDPSTGEYRHFRHDPSNPNSPSSDHLQAIHEGRDGTLWIGTFGGGLNRFDPSAGRWERYYERDGLANNVVYAILEDSSGSLWLSTNGGLSRFSPSDRTFRNFGRVDGLQADEFNFGAACRSRSGILYFGGINGFNAIDPGRIRQNPHIPPVVITAFFVLNEPFAGGPAAFALTRVTLPYDRNFLSFEFAALDYALPERNRYAYMLEGVDRNWVDAGSRRFARYTNLEPGEYVFRVRGANNDGAWNTAGTSMYIEIAPPLWQTLWFRMFAGGLLIAALFLAYRVRVARLLEVERMRLRIASDLHDDIGSSLASIAVISDMVLTRTALPPPEAKRLRDISLAARTTADALRDIVWVINPEHDQIDNIVLRLKDIAGKMLPGVEYVFRTSDGAASVRLPMAFRRDVVLMFKEILSNVARHSGASRVDITIGTSRTGLFLRVADNGCGYDTGAPAAGNGLASIRRRAGQIGGRASVTSDPGKGTVVEILARIPQTRYSFFKRNRIGSE